MSKPVQFSIEELKHLENFMNVHEDEMNPILERIRKRVKKSQTKIKVSSAKGKGRELQQQVCRDISLVTNIPYNQQDDQCLIHSREMGQAGVDVILRRRAGKRFPFSIECKNSESFDFPGTVSQAEANVEKGRDWLIVHKRKSLKRPVAILDWEVFAKLVAPSYS